MKDIRVTALSIGIVMVYACSLLAARSWDHELETLEVLNQVNREEISKLRSEVRGLRAELDIKEKEIVKLESRPQ